MTIRSHQVIHAGLAGRMDVFQELQQVEGVTVHQVDADAHIRLVLEKNKQNKSEFGFDLNLVWQKTCT